MKCPLKFGLYEFEGGETCIGAECGFYGAVCRNDDSEPKSDVSAADVDANDTCDALDTREKINALRAHYGAGPTAMTDEQIEAGREVYGAKKHVDMVIIDELHDSREKLEADVYNHIAISITPNKEDDGVLAPYATVLEWLDRQAAITERECIGDAGKASLMGVVANERECYEKRITELQAKVDELTAKLRESSAEREQLREYFGIALDKAHDLLTLVDESGNVYDRDEGLA